MPDWNAVVLVGLHSIRTDEGVLLAQMITHLGGAFVVTGIFLAAAYVLSRGRPWAHALGLIIALGGSVLSAEVLKSALQFERPDTVLWAVKAFDYGFPSMHAAAAMALYGYLAWYVYERAPRWKVPAFLCAATIILAVGFTRMYLGIHWPIDVIGGFLLGFVFIFLGVRVTRALESFESS